MLDRLYCPDFSAVFGDAFRNPYNYPMIDGLVWPTLIDIKQSSDGEKLLKLEPDGHHPAFYRRKLTINHLVTEFKASGIQGACMQAVELGREYGISSKTVIETCKKYPNLLFPIISPKMTPAGITEFVKQIDAAAAVVIYPSYQKINLGTPSAEMEQVIALCTEKNLPLKIDLGNMYLPDNDTTYCSVAIVRKFASAHPKLVVVLSGIDINGDGIAMINIARYERNVWIELDPRTFGGMTPDTFFSKCFAIPGFIQNCWSRVILSSVTPMLESSQITRGWITATEKLPFAMKCLMRTWMYRNLNRIYKLNLPNKKDLAGVDDVKFGEILPARVIQKSDSELFIQQDLALNSFSITQLLYVSPYILQAAADLVKQFPEYAFGEFTVKSYHTTTSLIVNEHEIGNYLQMHYQFAEDTMEEAGDKLHTVAAEENRADFNYPDHITASTRGDKDFTVPILDGKIQLGGRENVYVLVTFGPRAIKLSFSVKLFKGHNLK